MEDTEKIEQPIVVEKPSKKKDTAVKKSITYKPYRKLPANLSLISIYPSMDKLNEENKGSLIYKEKGVPNIVPNLYYVFDSNKDMKVCALECDIKNYI